MGGTTPQAGMNDLCGLGPHRHQRVVSQLSGVSVGGAVFGLAPHLTNSGIHINSHRIPVWSSAHGPDPPECFTQGLVHLADMTPGERTKKRAQCGRGHHPKRQHPVGGTGPQPVGMIDMGTAHQHGRHQRQHLATRTGPSDTISQPYSLVQQPFQPQPGHQRARYQQPRIGNQRLVIEHHPQPVNIVRYAVHNKCLLCLGDSGFRLQLFSQVREALHRINPHQPPNPSVDSGLVGVMFLYGGLSFPLYGLVISHMNDWIPTSKLLSAAGAPVFAVGVGAVAGPVLAGGWMSVAGPVGMWWFLVSIHGLFALYILYRLAERPNIPVALQKAFAPLPARGSAMVATLTPWRRTRYRPSHSKRNPKYPLTFG